MSAVRSAALAAAVVILGILVPVSTAVQVDSLATDLDVVGILAVFGTAWIVHLPLALAAMATAAGAAWLMRDQAIGRGLPGAILGGGFMLSAGLALRPLLPAALASIPVLLLAAVGTGVAALVLAARRSGTPSAPLGLALLGLPFAVLALVWPLLERRTVQIGVARPTAPDILILTMDALARGHMSGAGYHRKTTPRLDQLAGTAVEFTSLVAASNFTTPTINTLLTGQYPWTHGAFQLDSRPKPASVHSSLPAALKQAGYRLVAVTTNPNAGIFRNGYAMLFDEIATDQLPALGFCRDALARFLPHVCRASKIGVAGPLAWRLLLLLDDVGDRPRGWHHAAEPALAAADRLFTRLSDGRPVALWVHLMPPHDPYVAPEPFLGHFDPSPRMRRIRHAIPNYQEGWSAQQADHPLFIARYDEMVVAVDAAVGAFIDRLQREGRLERTILVVSADHGESFIPGYGGHGGPRVHEALVNIPLLIRAPGLPAGARHAEPVSQADIAPTVLELAGVGVPAAMEGRSLVPLITSGSMTPRPVFTMNLERGGQRQAPPAGTIAVIIGDFRYVLPWGYTECDPAVPEGLFRRSSDPAETNDLSAVFPRQARAMRSAAEAARRAYIAR